MSDEVKAADAGESTLSGTPAGAWETVTPKAEEPLHPQGVVLPPPANVRPDSSPVQGPYPPSAAAPAAPGSGYQPVYGGNPNASIPGAGYGQGYGGPAQAYPPNYGASAPPNYASGTPPPPPGYLPQGQGAQPPYGQQGYYPPPQGQQGYYQQQGQYNSPNVADMLAAGVLFGRGRRWQRRPGRLIFWPVMISVILLAGTLHGCMHLFSW